MVLSYYALKSGVDVTRRAFGDSGRSVHGHGTRCQPKQSTKPHNTRQQRNHVLTLATCRAPRLWKSGSNLQMRLTVPRLLRQNTWLCRTLTHSSHTIKDDSDVGHQTTKPADFAPVDSRSADELSAIWRKVKTIFLNARDCKDGGRDENAWCDDVFRPLLNLAIELYGKDRWWLQSV
ncbi:uncharacterized protein M421DRAFT_280261 [Didymella exigua CBS 183.55]|uniref:PD-(D/E)XK nuclease-like domain-containing protein n=1 Tax=Didymella exigua CBS 183.55 TaxID=1150837 RepID=A0A6A5RCJ4_9PLEO|nr:uncharacterized protein M421DRAFT_280261 [Didymella exigua CBS 183.55]KAF1924336.1 hypothetical protein M421DRAFT_280261 [Didymella exigua CBS 183.55]